MLSGRRLKDLLITQAYLRKGRPDKLKNILNFDFTTALADKNRQSFRNAPNYKRVHAAASVSCREFLYSAIRP